jgi:hypothetical protein
MLEATSIAGAPRWRALALAVALLGTLWGAGFAAGRISAPRAEPTGIQAHADQGTPEIIRPSHHGGVKVGPSTVESVSIRPRGHAGGQVKFGG